MKSKLHIICLLSALMCISTACSGGEIPTTSEPVDGGTYSITYAQSDYYKLNGPSEAKEGTEVTFAINDIADGFCLDYFLINNEVSTTNTFVMPIYNTYIEAALTTSDGNEYPINVGEYPHGKIATNKISAKACEEIQIYIEAETGYRLDKISANDVYLTVKDNTNSKYYTHTIMQNKPLYIEATFVPIEQQFTRFNFSMTGYNGGAPNPAISYWRFEYKPEGFYLEACVQDSIVFHHPTAAIWQRDNIELQMCLATEKNRPQDTKVLRCVLACDGRYAFYRVRSNSTYYMLGQNVGYQYGKNFTNEGIICTQAENGFDGYIIRALFGYDLFDSDYEHAKGNMTFCPAMRDTISYNESTKTVNEGWKTLTYTMSVDYMEAYMSSDFHSEWWNPRTFIGIRENGSLFDRYLTLDTDLLFVGDSYTMAKRYGSLYDDFADIKVSTVGFGNSDTTDWLTDKGTHNGLELVQSINPRNVALHIGGNDIYLRNKQLQATINNTKDIANRILNDLPSVQLYLMTMVKRVYHPSTKTSAEMNEMVDEYNSQISTFADSNTRIHLVDISSGLEKDDGTPITGVFKDSSSSVADTTHLNSFGYAFVSNQLRAALGLPKLSDSTKFGSYAKCNATNGFTYETDDNGNEYLRQRNSMKNSVANFRDRYVYFKQNVNDDFIASANFNISETFNGTDDIKFGFIINDGLNQIYYYLNTNEYIVKKYIGIASRVDGVYDWTIKEAGPYINAYFTEDDYTNLTIKKEGTVLKFLVNGYELHSFTPDFLASSYQVGFFSFDVALNVKNPTIQIGGLA